MGYRVALMPLEVAEGHAAARQVYGRRPNAGVPSTLQSETFLSALIQRWPSIAERPSRFTGDIVIDDDAPFQIDIDGGVVLLDVSWGALTTVLPVVHALARSSSIAMYLPYEGEIIPRPPTASWREPFEYVGRLVRPDEDVDLSPGWQLRQDREVQLIDDAVDVGHGDGDWHHGP
jgi:hypothetical protein